MWKLTSEVAEIKSTLADGKAKEKDYQLKEILQTINRVSADALRDLKNKF